MAPATSLARLRKQALDLVMSGRMKATEACRPLQISFGYSAKSQIDRSGGAEGGRGLAVAGIVLGWVGVGTLALVLLLFAAAATSGPSF